MARLALVAAIQENKRLLYDQQSLPVSLLEMGASFVTLKKHHHLRGCIGTLAAHQSLVTDVLEHTVQAALSDPRFPPVTVSELSDIMIYISVLTQPEALVFHSEQDCIGQLRVGIDGVILSDKGHRGTFLPSVWEELPNPQDFFSHLKNKAGFQKNYWSETVSVQRYQVQYLAEDGII